MRILAGVSLNALIGDNGILTQAIKAKELSNISSEREILELKLVETQMDEDGKNQAKLGEALSEVSVIKGDWKNVIVGDQIYKDGWYLLEKGDYISEEYGEAKNNWLINYDTGKIIELEEGKYTVASANASGAIVDETLKLNIDPSNMQDQAKWGDNVRYCGADGSEESGVKETEIRFDGIDDYLRIKGVNVDKNEGITFEFYGRSDDGGLFYPLTKSYFNGDELEKTTKSNTINLGFRTRLNFALGELACNFGLGKADSNLAGKDSYTWHWIFFNNLSIESRTDFYFSLVIDFNSGKSENRTYIKLYKDGEIAQETSCSTEYMESGDVFKNDSDFTVGLMSYTPGDGTIKHDFSKMDLYACRLYDRVLSAEEIKQNFVGSKSYHEGMKQ